MKSACGELTTTFMSAGLPGTMDKIKNAIKFPSLRLFVKLFLLQGFKFSVRNLKNFTIFLRLAVSYRRSHAITDSCECQYLNRVIRIFSQTREDSG